MHSGSMVHEVVKYILWNTMQLQEKNKIMHLVETWISQRIHKEYHASDICQKEKIQVDTEWSPSYLEFKDSQNHNQ